VKVTVFVLLGALITSSCVSVFGSKQKFHAYVEGLGLVGLPISEATTRLSLEGFNCDPSDKLPMTAPVVCGRYIVGWNLAEELSVSLNRSPDGATVASEAPSYLPITGP
jgi:hypothetical protein